MKGYKGMDKNMRCRGMQYEVGKSYHVDGAIRLCSNGLHFCGRLKDVFDYYQRDGNRFFEVIAAGEIISGKKKSVASDLMIVRELEEIEINKCFYDDSYGDGYGYSYGDGDGCGDGYGYGYGDEYGNGNGYGDGAGIGGGNSYGNSYGNEYGNKYGYGNGNIQKILLFV